MPILSVTSPKTYFKIPEGWNVNDIWVNGDKLYYKGELKDVPCREGDDEDDEPLKIEDDGEYDFLFSEDEEE